MRINLRSKRLASLGFEAKQGRAVVTALEPERVYLKAPRFFRIAQQMGYWQNLNVKLGVGADAEEVCGSHLLAHSGSQGALTQRISVLLGRLREDDLPP